MAPLRVGDRVAYRWPSGDLDPGVVESIDHDYAWPQGGPRTDRIVIRTDRGSAIGAEPSAIVAFRD